LQNSLIRFRMLDHLMVEHGRNLRLRGHRRHSTENLKT
jgi:hypothetical protein